MKFFAHNTQRILSFSPLVLMLMAIAMWGCEPPRKHKSDPSSEDGSRPLETTTIGEINLGIDITMEPVLKQIVDAFMQDNPKAILHPTYATEGDLVDYLLADSMRMVIISRELRSGEINAIRKDKVRPTATLIGRDAVVVVMHPESPMDSITMVQLGKLMRGEAKTWRDIGGNSDEVVNLVFDAPKSSTVRMVQEKFMKADQQLPANAFQTNSQDKVIDYVSQSKNAIGFVGYCFVSDRDDARVKERLAKVKLARLDATDTSDVKGYFIRPYQNEIALGRYPLSRPIYAVSREHFVGLGTGFVVYAAGELGQRIFLKAGLVPEFMPPRLIVLPEKEE
jgi:phosphate transport system substrate-binding protein